MPPLDILSYQLKHPVIEMSYIYLSNWPKGPYGNPQTFQAIVKVIGSSSQTSAKTLLLNKTHILLNMKKSN